MSSNRNINALSSHPSSLFGTATQNPALQSGMLENFLDLKDKIHLLQVNKQQRSSKLLNTTFKKALLKELVLAYQEPCSPYTAAEAEALREAVLILFSKETLLCQLAVAVSYRMSEEKEAGEEKPHDPEAFIQELKEPHQQALAKFTLLELIRAHQLAKASALVKKFPSFLNSDQDQLSYLFALMVSGYQNEAETFIKSLIKEKPYFLAQVAVVVDRDGETYKDITPYQYTLCVKHSQMRLMLRAYLAPGHAAYQAEEYEAQTNKDMVALSQKYKQLMQRSQETLEFYLDHEKKDSWTGQQSVDYWDRVYAGLQREWPVHWMQELLLVREFNANTDFSSEAALKALPEAKLSFNEIFYPRDKGYDGASLHFKNYSEEQEIKLEDLSQERLQLIQKGARYFIYGPVLPTDIKQLVSWELKELEARFLSKFLETQPKYSQITNAQVTYNYPHTPYFKAVLKAVDNALGGRVAGNGFSFSGAMVNANPHGIFSLHSPGLLGPDNLAGLQRLDQVRTEELNAELMSLRALLPPKEKKPVLRLDFLGGKTNKVERPQTPSSEKSKSSFSPAGC